MLPLVMKRYFLAFFSSRQSSMKAGKTYSQGEWQDQDETEETIEEDMDTGGGKSRIVRIDARKQQTAFIANRHVL